MHTVHRIFRFWPKLISYTSKQRSTDCNLYSKYCSDQPENILLIEANGRTISYGEHSQLVCRLGRWLITNGLKSGDRLMVQLPKSHLVLALCHACMKNGSIFVPLSAAYRTDEMRYFINDAKPKIVVTSTSNVDQYSSLCPPEMKLVSDVALNFESNKLDPWESIEPVESDDVAAICYTSGTTGQPKGAMITHGNLSSNAASLKTLWEIQERDTLLHTLPLDHIHGLFVSLNSCFMAGSKVIFLPAFQMDHVLKWLPKCTVLMGVPTYYSRLEGQGQCTRRVLGHLRLLISGSAPLPTKLWFQYAQNGGQEILERYGMTEGQIICSNPVRGRRKPGTVGTPLPNIQIAIRDGILYYKGSNTFKGYWEKDEKTKQEFTSDGFFNSGDLASIDDDGYICITGRRKDVIITGGLNVYPKEIEAHLDSLEWVQESAVIGVPHPDYGEAVIAVMVLKDDDHAAMSELYVVEYLKKKMAAYKVPKRVMFVKQLPRNAMAKIQKNLLRQSFEGLFADSGLFLE